MAGEYTDDSLMQGQYDAICYVSNHRALLSFIQYRATLQTQKQPALWSAAIVVMLKCTILYQEQLLKTYRNRGTTFQITEKSDSGDMAVLPPCHTAIKVLRSSSTSSLCHILNQYQHHKL